MEFAEDALCAQEPRMKHRMTLLRVGDWVIHFSREPKVKKDPTFVAHILGSFNDSGYVNCEFYEPGSIRRWEEVHICEMDARLSEGCALMIIDDLNRGRSVRPVLKPTWPGDSEVVGCTSQVTSKEGIRTEVFYPVDNGGFYDE